MNLQGASNELAWQHQAACTGAPTDWFFPGAPGKGGTAAITPEAAEICEGCPVADNCLDYALTHLVDGIWAGTTWDQRRRRRRALGITADPLMPPGVHGPKPLTDHELAELYATQGAPMPITRERPTVADVDAPQAAADGLVWENPPPVRRGPGAIEYPTAKWAEQLRARPGAWARLHEYDKKSSAASFVGRWKKGEMLDLPIDQFELTARRTPTGSAVYGRCTVEAEPA